MYKVTELPIVGGIFQALNTYGLQTKFIVSRPFKFCRRIDFNDSRELRKAFEYLLASHVVSYIILIPVFVIYNFDKSQSIFLIFQNLRMLIGILCVHVVLRLLGSKKSFRTTFILQSYVIGFFSPAGILLSMPVCLAAGPDLLFGSFSQFADQELLTRWDRKLMGDHVLFFRYAYMLFLIWGSFVHLSWFSFGHSLSKWRVLCGILLGSFLGILLIELIFTPTWGVIEKVLAEILKFA